MGCAFSICDCALCPKREQLVDESAIWYSDLAALEATEASAPEEAATADAVTPSPAPPSEQAAMADAGQQKPASPSAGAEVPPATPPARVVRKRRPAARGRRVTFARDMEIVFPIPKLLGPFVLIQVVKELTDSGDVPVDYLSCLPTPLLLKILSLLDDESLLHVSMTCCKLAHVCRKQPAMRTRIEKQIARAMVYVEEDSRECNLLWTHVLYMWEARCPFVFKYRRVTNDLNKEVLNDLNQYTVDNLARAILPKRMNIRVQ